MNLGSNCAKFGSSRLSISILSQDGTIHQILLKSGKNLSRWTFYNPLKLEKSSVQWLPLENRQSPFYVLNVVTLTGQKPTLNFC